MKIQRKNVLSQRNIVSINRKNVVLYRKNDRREGKMPFIISV
jgi:hypothetical protein